MKSVVAATAVITSVSMSVGCTVAPDVVRGQSPNIVVPQYAPAGVSGRVTPSSFQTLPGLAVAAAASDPCTGAACGSTAGSQCSWGYYPTSAGTCQDCRGRGCQSCRNCNLPCHPVHRNFHTYDLPSGLRYPQQNTPAAVYQYPYYTLRGPTDFRSKSGYGGM